MLIWPFWWSTTQQSRAITKKKKNPAEGLTSKQTRHDANAWDKLARATEITVVFLNSGIWCHAEEGAIASASVAPCQAASTRLRWGKETGNAPAERPQPHDSACPCALGPAQSEPRGNKDVAVESLTHWTVPRSGITRRGGGKWTMHVVMYLQGARACMSCPTSSTSTGIKAQTSATLVPYKYVVTLHWLKRSALVRKLVPLFFGLGKKENPCYCTPSPKNAPFISTVGLDFNVRPPAGS